MNQPSLVLSRLQSLNPNDPTFAVEAVDLVLRIALDSHATDIHWQPRRDGWSIEMRIDGVLQSLAQLPLGKGTDPVARLKVLAGLLTYQTNVPQEGRLSGLPEEREARLSTFPTVYGERAVVRILQRGRMARRLDDLGFHHAIVSQLRSLLSQRDGAIIIAGPAGSGKTTTLYALLMELSEVASTRRAVLTVEDPVESVIDTISQSRLDASSGFDLAAALRSVLRQDPEVLMIGEVRDPESAEAALRAALTGHLVLTSLHAGDVAMGLRRFQELGIPPYLIRSGLRAILSQRLLRRLCTHCREPIDGPCCGAPQGLRYRAKGCGSCLGTGYAGRVPVAELVRLDSGIMAEVLAESLDRSLPAREIYCLIRERGFSTLEVAAMERVAEGTTSLEEVYRVFGATVNGQAMIEGTE